MEYKGKLYGKVGGIVFPLLHTTEDWEKMETENTKLKVAAKEWIEASNQHSFFLEGYKNGSASISEATAAALNEHTAYVKMFDLIKELK